MSEATQYAELANIDIRDFGYVKEETALAAKCAPITGRKTPTGYIFVYSDGSELDFNKFTLEMEALS